MAATLVRGDGGESVLRGREGERESGLNDYHGGWRWSGMCLGLTGFWCTDGYAVCATLGAVGLNNGTMRRGSVWWC